MGYPFANEDCNLIEQDRTVQIKNVLCDSDSDIDAEGSKRIKDWRIENERVEIERRNDSCTKTISRCT